MDDQFHIHPLFRGPSVAVTDIRCRPSGCECGPEECSERTSIVFPRSGAFVRHVGRQRIPGNCNHVLFFRGGETYRVSHPVAGGDDCTSIAFDRQILTDAVSRFDPAARDRPRSPLDLTHGPCPAAIGHFLQRLRQHLRAGVVDALAVEELTVTLLEAVLDVAYRVRGKREVRPERSSARVQRERVEATKCHLMGRFREPLSLVAIARAVHYSPYHLARLFRREAGESIHRYLNRLRLGVGLEQLAEGASDLTALALDLGFSSHSHFSTAFRREFGVSPSALRTPLPAARVRELSTILKAGRPLPRVG
jgi:AraC family transcriptional regulator